MSKRIDVNMSEYVSGNGGVLRTDPQLEEVNPKLTDEERQALIQKLVSDGQVVDPLIVWKGKDLLVFGYEEFRLAEEFNLKFQTKELVFGTKGDCLAWIIEKRISQPSLNLFQKVELALPYGEYWKDKAKKNKGARTDLCKDALLRFQSLDVLEIIGIKASTSRTTVNKVRNILDSGKKALIGKCRTGELSIEAAYNLLKNADQDSQKSEAKQVEVQEKKAATGRKRKTAEIAALAKYTVKGFSSTREKLSAEGLKFFILRWNEEHKDNPISSEEVQKTVTKYSRKS